MIILLSVVGFVLDGTVAYFLFGKSDDYVVLQEHQHMYENVSSEKNVINFTLHFDGRLTNMTLVGRGRNSSNLHFVVKVKHKDGNEEVILQEPHSCIYSGILPHIPYSWVHLSTCGQRNSGFVFDGVDLLSLKSISKTSWTIGGKYKIQRVVHQGPSRAQCLPIYSYTQTINTRTFSDSNRKRQKRFSAEEKKIIELYVVIDANMFSDTGINKNKTVAVQYVENMVQHLDKIYQAIGIQVVLVGLEIWTADPIVLPTDATQLLTEFLEYSYHNISNAMKMDFRLLLSGLTFQNFIVGMAHVGVLCGRQSAAVVHYERFNPVKAAVTSAHEIGHVIGLLHDDPSCNCSDSKRKCIMEPDISAVPTLFSSCSRETLKSVLSDGAGTCLYDIPDVVYKGPICGNGIRERNEICDCGNQKECSRSRCCSYGCHLKPGAECDNGGCCKKCKKQPVCTSCRSSQNDCDLEEFCDGVSEDCPANMYKRDLTSCGKSGATGFCYHGKCRSNQAQCQYLWGYGAHPSDSFCFNANKVGSTTGNCGTKTKHPTPIYHKCKQSDIMCGMINCDSPRQYPIIGGRQKVIINTYTLPNSTKKTCRAAIIDLGDDVPDPGLVDDGSPCSYGNTSGVCLNQKCEPLTSVSQKTCPHGSNGLECSGNGICNNHGDCWCNYGYSGRDCSSHYNPCIEYSSKSDDKFPDWAIGVVAGVPAIIIFVILTITIRIKRLLCWKNVPRSTKVEKLTF